MNSEDTTQKANIDQCIRKLNKVHKQRLGPVGPPIGMLLILLFAIALLPLYLFLVFFNIAYFWIRRQKRIDPRPYFNFDRHNIAHLRFADKMWCDYCEWANGSLQWALAITNEIERRYCPIQNQCHPHCEKAKNWRDEFIHYAHKPEDVERYYQDRYLQESKLDD
ncbi:hypothetical protein GALL_398680 [mine drainage metagenome]|uniref:Transmembrane protein n=1 Tax=mine drainage metagenome TaxID=410659 RepID=A0A1J5QEK1_9ZZZZ